VHVKDGDGVRGVVPQKIRIPESGMAAQGVQLMFRPAGVYENATLRIMDGEKEIHKAKKRILTPGEMAEVTLKSDILNALSGADLTVRIDP